MPLTGCSQNAGCYEIHSLGACGSSEAEMYHGISSAAFSYCLVSLLPALKTFFVAYLDRDSFQPVFVNYIFKGAKRCGRSGVNYILHNSRKGEYR